MFFSKRCKMHTKICMSLFWIPLNAVWLKSRQIKGANHKVRQRKIHFNRIFAGFIFILESSIWDILCILKEPLEFQMVQDFQLLKNSQLFYYSRHHVDPSGDISGVISLSLYITLWYWNKFLKVSGNLLALFW